MIINLNNIIFLKIPIIWGKLVEGKWKEIPHTKSFIREINKNRDKIGLDDIETFRRKVKYETKNRLFIFFRHEAIVDLAGFSEQQWDAGNNKLKK